jgi:hypothetical protein
VRNDLGDRLFPIALKFLEGPQPGSLSTENKNTVMIVLPFGGRIISDILARPLLQRISCSGADFAEAMVRAERVIAVLNGTGKFSLTTVTSGFISARFFAEMNPSPHLNNGP